MDVYILLISDPTDAIQTLGRREDHVPSPMHSTNYGAWPLKKTMT